jgi:hypothetical protein
VGSLDVASDILVASLLDVVRDQQNVGATSQLPLRREPHEHPAKGPRAAWSYGYNPRRRPRPAPDDSGRQVQFLRKLGVFEVSPVLRGAGVATKPSRRRKKLCGHLPGRSATGGFPDPDPGW